ncbi:MAG: hypothetical protein QM497_03680 [Sulfurimonas sp.]
MKINISRQNIYLIAISVFLFIFVLIFAFLVLIPNGKEYRKNRVQLKVHSKELRKYQNFYDETQLKLKELQKKHRHVIVAFDSKFNPQRFQKQYKSYFSSLKLSEVKKSVRKEEFTTYEVNTTSQISSPKSFYNFLDAVNKSDWIIGVNFPIEFKRDGELIKSTFTMEVLSNSKDENKTKIIEL